MIYEVLQNNFYKGNVNAFFFNFMILNTYVNVNSVREFVAIWSDIQGDKRLVLKEENSRNNSL